MPDRAFLGEFESARARLCFAAERGFVDAQGGGPARVAAAVRAVFEFASLNPDTVRTLTSRALAHGSYGVARHHDLLGAAAGVLGFSRAEGEENAHPPDATDRFLAGGVAGILMARLEAGRAEEVP